MLKGRHLLVQFTHHPHYTATFDYLDGDTFRLTYSNPAFGCFAAPFIAEQGQGRSVEVGVSDFIDPDPYVFVKQ